VDGKVEVVLGVVRSQVGMGEGLDFGHCAKWDGVGWKTKVAPTVQFGPTLLKKHPTLIRSLTLPPQFFWRLNLPRAFSESVLDKDDSGAHEPEIALFSARFGFLAAATYHPSLDRQASATSGRPPRC
jgi:hypothetical protein